MIIFFLSPAVEEPTVDVDPDYGWELTPDEYTWYIEDGGV